MVMLLRIAVLPYRPHNDIRFLLNGNRTGRVALDCQICSRVDSAAMM